MMMVVIQWQFGQYLKQKDIAKMVIKSHMKEQSQSQFQLYLEKSLDSVIIVSKMYQKVLFCNQNALDILQSTNKGLNDVSDVNI
jgi:L-rhamnose isomerase